MANMSKVLAEEVAEFKVRVLIFSLGTFHTNMGNVVTIYKNAVPEDYKGSVAEIRSLTIWLAGSSALMATRPSR